MSNLIKFEVHLEPDRWSAGDYSLSWDPQTKVLRYWAEGRDNPKDLWGFEREYPPREMDEGTKKEILKIFGPEIFEQVSEWLVAIENCRSADSF
jgi:hypothetical protein